MLTIMCIDSHQQRLTQLISDLSVFTSQFNIITAQNKQQAEALVTDYHDRIAVVIAAQHIQDDDAVSIFSHPHLQQARKIIYGEKLCPQQLTTGVNDNLIDYALALPYQKAQLIKLIERHIEDYRSSLSARQQAITDTTYEDIFLELSQHSDHELSELVMNSLYKILEDSPNSGVKLHYDVNHLLTKEDEPNRFLWFITKGRVQLQKRNAQGIEQNITVMEAGSLIGGMSFLTSANAFSSAITLTDTEVIKVDNTLFSKLMSSNAQLLAPFTNLLLRHFSWRLRESISTELALQESLQSLDAAYQQLLESEKMAVLGQLIAGVAHELNNPVSAIIRGSETLTDLMPKLCSDKTNDPFNRLAAQTLHNALSINALSTIEVRQRTREIQHDIADKKLAKKIANMQLKEINIPLQHGQDFASSIDQLHHFHQAGTIIRNSQSCANRIANLVQSLKHYARQDPKQAIKVNLHEGLEETLIIFESRLKHYKVIKQYSTLPEIECHPIELEQVWTNLIANAIDVMGKTGTLTITTRHLTHYIPDVIQVCIEDSGTGISDKLKDKVFELNYTTKREGNFGLGIGLSISSQIIKRHDGHIHIEDNTLGGATFIVTLPIKARTRKELED